MSLSLLVVIASCLALAAVVILVYKRRPRSFDLDALAVQLHSVDVDAFLNLINPREQEYLQRQLPPPVFRKIHRERMRAGLEYAWHAARNARILGRLAEAATHDPNPQTAVAAEHLRRDALTLRLRALQLLPQLCWKVVFPGGRELPESVAQDYNIASCSFVTLARLRSVRAMSNSV